VPTATELLADPDWFPHAVDVRSGAMRFVRIPRDVQRGVTFLADEYLPQSASRADLTANDLQRRVSPGRPHFVFHSAFCCSTLLTRALDVPGRVFGLKEPATLNDLAAAKLARAPAARLTDLLDRVLSLLARTATPGEAIVIKPSNVANNLLESCLELRPQAQALLMYSRLPVFLRSIAHKGLWGRSWARQLFQRLRPTATIDTGFSADELFRQTDLQIAGLCWLMQHAQFVQALARFGDARIRTLDSATLLAHPEQTLLAVSAHLALGLTPEATATIARGPVFRENSKTMTEDYDRVVRAAEHAAVDAAHGEEIGMVTQWVQTVAQHCGVSLTIGAPLFAHI
jgi:hypothetical protein